MNIVLFVLLGLSVGLNWGLYKIAKELKKSLFEQTHKEDFIESDFVEISEVEE